MRCLRDGMERHVGQPFRERRDAGEALRPGQEIDRSRKRGKGLGRNGVGARPLLPRDEGEAYWGIGTHNAGQRIELGFISKEDAVLMGLAFLLRAG